MPAFAVVEFRCRPGVLDEARCSLVVFGYDMDNMKARQWYESRMPLIALPDDEDLRTLFEIDTERLIAAADHAGGKVAWAIKLALFGQRQAGDAAKYALPRDLRGNFGDIGESFWQRTEATFYEALRAVHQALTG